MTLEKIEENVVEYEIEADYTYCYMLRSDKGFNPMNAAFLSKNRQNTPSIIFDLGGD